MTTLNIILQAPPSFGGNSGGSFPYLLVIILIVIVVAIVSSRKNKKEDESISTEGQINKVINVSLTGGIIGLFISSPQSTLNRIIKKENATGWKVIQIIPADSGNIFLYVFRLLLLVITLFLFTTSNGYYIILEKEKIDI